MESQVGTIKFGVHLVHGRVMVRAKEDNIVARIRATSAKPLNVVPFSERTKSAVEWPSGAYLTTTVVKTFELSNQSRVAAMSLETHFASAFAFFRRLHLFHTRWFSRRDLVDPERGNLVDPARGGGRCKREAACLMV